MIPFVVVAAYNEEAKIADVLTDLRQHGYAHIVVVDDGSKDNTTLVAEKAGATVLHHVVNRGQGAALKTGLDYALSEGAEVIITFDGDGQHQAKDIAKLIAPIEHGEAEVVLGSRFLKGSRSNLPLIKKILLPGARLLIRIMYHIKTTDSHNGLRALSRHAAQTIQIKANGMEHASEILEEIAAKQLRYTEVPVDIRYTEYSITHGQSPLNAFNILFKMLIKKLMR